MDFHNNNWDILSLDQDLLAFELEQTHKPRKNSFVDLMSDFPLQPIYQDLNDSLILPEMSTKATSPEP